MVNGKLLVSTRRLDVLARMSPRMGGRPLGVQDGAQGRKKSGTRGFHLNVWSRAVIARDGPTFKMLVSILSRKSEFRVCRTGEFREAHGSPGTL